MASLSWANLDAAGEPVHADTSADMAAGGPGVVVCGDRPDKDLPTTQELTKWY
jgi:hypothetical protein